MYGYSCTLLCGLACVNKFNSGAGVCRSFWTVPQLPCFPFLLLDEMFWVIAVSWDCKSILKAEIVLQSWDYWHAAASFERSTQMSTVDVEMRDAGRRWCKAPASEMRSCFTHSPIWTEFVVSLPFPVTHWLQAMGNAVLPIPEMPVCRSAVGSWLCSPMNSCICFTPGEGTEIQTPECNDSLSWAHTLSAVWIGSSGVCRSAEPQQGGYCAGVSFQSVRLWFRFLRIFVVSE